MPYIPQEDRKKVPNHETNARSVGELNYEITTLVNSWLRNNGLCYATLNSAIGVLECAKLELYRRVAAPYEDGKRTENGDVYTVPR